MRKYLLKRISMLFLILLLVISSNVAYSAVPLEQNLFLVVTGTVQTGQERVQHTFPAGTIIKKMTITQEDAAVAGYSYRYTVMSNGVAVAQTPFLYQGQSHTLTFTTPLSEETTITAWRSTNAQSHFYQITTSISYVSTESIPGLQEIQAVQNAVNNATIKATDAYNQAWEANIKLDNLQTEVTNIQNRLGGDTSPPEVKIKTTSGAVATSGNSIRVVLDISDNISTNFTYSLDKLTYQPIPSDDIIVLPVNNSGTNIIPVWVRDEAGNIGKASIAIRKI